MEGWPSPFMPTRRRAALVLLSLSATLLRGVAGMERHGEPVNGTAGHVEHGVSAVTVRFEECYHNAHPHEGLIFLFTALSVGTTMMFLTMFPTFHGMQQTVVIYLLGLLYSVLGERNKLWGKTGMFGHSYCIWMNIDPHLLLFAMLPALLTGDAMAIDTSVARRVYRQCIYLAGPGVLFCAFATAGFLKWYLPYDWNFLLCLTVGSILAATDPVAVVGLLKELGASPTLTVQIQGESLLNDGTAIVLFNVAYRLLGGEEFSANDVLIFLVKVVLCAIALGFIIGWVCLIWIHNSCKRLDLHSSFVQISITLLCAYWSYILAEGLGISGVLTTVTASLVLADKMWPSIVSRESMDTVWHMFEFMGNTVIFFVAGALSGNVMSQMSGADWMHLFVLYVMCNVIRGLMLVLSLPIIKMLGVDKQSVTLADTAVMCWGGLRGAVGLSLAIQVEIEKAGNSVHAKDAKRVLFFTSGIAALTLLVNATTCPLLVKWLKIAGTPKARQNTMAAIHWQLLQIAQKEWGHRPSEDAPPEVREIHTLVGTIMRQMLRDVHLEITEGEGGCCDFVPCLRKKVPEELTEDTEDPASQGTHSTSTVQGTLSFLSSMSDTPDGETAREHVSRRLTHISIVSIDDGGKFIEKYSMAYQMYKDLPEDMLTLLQLPKIRPEGQHDIFNLVMRERPIKDMIRVVNEAFLGLVHAEYWAANARGEFMDDAEVRSCLVDSVACAMESASCELADLRFIINHVRDDGELDIEEVGYDFEADVLDMNVPGGDPSVEGTFCKSIMTSTWFRLGMAIVILSNTITVGVEIAYIGDLTSLVWPLVNLSFGLFYIAEFCVLFGALSYRYFMTFRNVFDFTLLVLGVAGSILEFAVVSHNPQLLQSAYIGRIAYVFRILRNLRVAFRVALAASMLRLRMGPAGCSSMEGMLSLINQARKADKTVVQVRYLTILNSYVKVQCHCQKEFVQYFGKHGKLQSCEAARCLLASQMQVFVAMKMACNVAKMVDKPALIALHVLRESNRVAETLLEFVHCAHSSGILAAQETHSFRAPLKANMQNISNKLRLAFRGHLYDLPNKAIMGGSPVRDPAEEGVSWVRSSMEVKIDDDASTADACVGTSSETFEDKLSESYGFVGLSGARSHDAFTDSCNNGRFASKACMAFGNEAFKEVPSTKLWHPPPSSAMPHTPVPSDARAAKGREAGASLLAPCPRPPSPPPSLPTSPTHSPKALSAHRSIERVRASPDAHVRHGHRSPRYVSTRGGLNKQPLRDFLGQLVSGLVSALVS